MQGLKEALAKRRGRGLEITIQVEPKEEKDTDLAPPGENPESPESKEEPPILDDSYEPEMSEHEVEMLKTMPKEGMSLGERARFAHLKKK